MYEFVSFSLLCIVIYIQIFGLVEDTLVKQSVKTRFEILSSMYISVDLNTFELLGRSVDQVLRNYIFTQR